MDGNMMCLPLPPVPPPMSPLQVHLNVFQYFMFWAAFYVLRGARSTDKG